MPRVRRWFRRPWTRPSRAGPPSPSHTGSPPSRTRGRFTSLKMGESLSMEPTVSWSTWEAATSNFGTQTRVEQFEVFSDKTNLNKYLLKEQSCQCHWISEYCIWRLLARNFGMCLGEFKCTLQGLLAKNSIFINIWWKIVDSFGCPQFISSRAISSAWEKNVLRISCWNPKLIILLLDCFLSGNPPWQAIIMLQRMPYIFKTSIFSPSHDSP